jgi:hypothetical protein
MNRLHGLCYPVLILLVAGCARQTDEEALAMPPRLPAAMVAPVREAMPLQDMLDRLLMDIDSALAGNVQGPAESYLLRAEATTDRLLEARMPFETLGGERYSLPARLRQIQSQADRAVAILYAGLPRDQVIEETRLLHSQVQQLRQDLEVGGTSAPPPVYRLIEALDTARAGGASVAPAETPPAPPTVTPPDTLAGG